MELYGYEKTKNAMQLGKVEKALSKLIRYNGKVMNKLEFTIALYKQGGIPEVHKSFGNIVRMKDKTFVDGLLKCQIELLQYLIDNKIIIE